MKIAVIGTGISGLGAAYLLNKVHEIDLFEANDYIGGHTNTIVVPERKGPVGVDTGFIVYNTKTYPYLIRLFDELGVQTQPSNMSFSISCRETGFECASHRYRGLLARKRNVITPAFWQIVWGDRRFRREGTADMVDPRYAAYTVGQYIDEKRFPPGFVQYILLPVASAIWSSPQVAIRDFPLQYLLGFYHNHGVLESHRDVQWRTVTGGSHEYVKLLTRPFGHNIHLNAPVRAVRRHPDHVTLALDDGLERRYDHVVIATHSDQALQLLADATPAEQAILGRIPYEENTAVLHTDERLLPRYRHAWASWNYTLAPGYTADQPVSLTYWMNSLQSLTTEANYSVTINPTEPIDPAKIIKTITYAHPVYSLDSLAARQQLPEINGQHRTHFCGAYFGYGFHEDGLASGVAAAAQLGAAWDDDTPLHAERSLKVGGEERGL